MATLKQKMAVDNLAGNVGMSTAQAMIKAGYSPITADTPQRLTDSKGYKELLKLHHLDEQRYLKKLDQALEAKKWNDFTGEREDDFKTVLPYHTKLGKLLGVEREDIATTNIVVVPILGGKTVDVQSNDSDTQNTGIEEKN